MAPRGTTLASVNACVCLVSYKDLIKIVGLNLKGYNTWNSFSICLFPLMVSPVKSFPAVLASQ
jgi:hypothetical protein